MGPTSLVSVLLAAGLLGQGSAGDKGPKPVAITDKHFRVYDGKGNASSLDDLLRHTRDADVVFLGELHDDPVGHHLQARLLQAAHKQRQQPLVLSLEMFERDVQHVVDEYLAGLITETHFLAGSRPWQNYQSDYRPLVEYARRHCIAVVAANAPRRYVNRVGRLGAASLREIPDPPRRGLPPLPYAEASAEYAAKFNALMKKHENPKKDGAAAPAAAPKEEGVRMPPADAPQPGAALARSLEAQSLWDASMAYSIAESLMRAPRARVIHVNGRFHTEKRLGIPDHLLRYRPGTSFLVVSFAPHKTFPKFDRELNGLGDFVIVTDPSLPRSYKSGAPKK